MASNRIQEGEVLTLTAPYAVASGAGVQVGAVFGVALAAAAISEEVEVARCGVWTLTKVGSQAWTKHVTPVYWDNTNKRCTSVAAGNTLIGVAGADVGSGSGATTGAVILFPNANEAGVLKATGTLDFASISTLSSADLTITVTGAAVGDVVALGLPAAPTAGIAFNAFVSAADTVTVRAHNYTGGSVNPASADYSVAVFKQ